jgi:hypothetical protein
LCSFFVVLLNKQKRLSLVNQMAARLHKFPDQNASPSCTLNNLIESKYFTLIMLVVVVSNTILMIFETYDNYHQKY